jgi:MFS family permease
MFGYTLTAFGSLFFWIPSLPEVIDSYKIKYNIVEEDELLNDKASGIYSAFYSLGAVIAPIIGGIINDHLDFRLTNDIMAILCFVFLLIYGIFNVSKSDFKCVKPEIKKIND